ncbi:hypothetical protein QOZ80_8AG0634300 [Eleusine coracana subsp. coracana]|nr:hypothetical protein QOZ80_8AG0634300 [Eleusine coracana subsp. coracana]
MALSISSALLLLLNMAGTLLSPRAPPGPPAPADSGAGNDDVDFFFFPFLILYKSGRVQRLMGTDTVPAATDPATGVASRDVVIDAATGLAARLYLPSIIANTTSSSSSKLPLVVFFHGGAFVTESASSPTYQRYLNALASRAGALVVSVDYRLAPEHRVPAAHDDAAGGNLAHNVAMRAGKEGLENAAVRGIALLDPYFWGKRPVPSETRDAAARRWRERTWAFVCAGAYGVDDPVINPVAMAPAEWRRLASPRVLVTVAGLDTLSARGRAYVHALRASGWEGEVELYETPGEYHVYFLTKPESEEAAKELEAVAGFIRGDRVRVSAPSRMDA